MRSARMIMRIIGTGLLIAAMTAVAAAQPAVSISPAAATINPGESVTVNVVVTNISPSEPLHAVNITVAFDNAVVSLTSSAQGTFLNSGGGQVYAPSPLLTSNTITFSQAILGSTYDVSGSGTVYSLTFTGTARGVSAIALTHVDLRSLTTPDQQTIISATSNNGAITVGTTVANVKAFLAGPFASGSMGLSLRAAGYVPLAQPYSGSPWSYAGTESVASIPASVVDWVLVELRTGTAAATKVATRAAFIKADGSIVDVDGTSPVSFPASVAAGSYYIVVRHRNHLAVMSANPASLSVTSALYDFTTGLAKYYGSDAKEVVTGVFGLWPGDATGNGVVRYSGSANDRAAILTRIGGTDLTATTSGYYTEDVNLNGIVRYSGSSNDRSIILTTVGGTDLTATRSTKVPN